MAKQLIQDIIKKKTGPQVFLKIPKEEEEKPPKKKLEFKPPIPKIPRLRFFPRGWKMKLVLGCTALGMVMIGGITLLNKFSSIEVEITPHQQVVEVDAVFKASVQPQKNELPLEIMQINNSEKGTAKPSGVKQISRKASGQIIVYNAYSSQPQPLVKDTRFETPDGKIYHINKSITVPGAKVEEGKIIPSEIEVTVYADKPGEEYNIDLTDFTIPGFKNSVKYEKFYGRSKTRMEGGFVGEVSVITEDDIKNLQLLLREKAKNYLLKTALNPKPDLFLFYDNARQIVFEEKNGPKSGDESDQLELEEKASLFGFLLRKSDLYQILGEKYLNPEAASQIEVINADKLAFELKSFSEGSITFNLKGQALFVFKVDENAIKADLVKAEENANLVFTKYPAIEKARIVFKPSWWRYIPKNPERIVIYRLLPP